jgi:hypothetical protein
LKTWCTSRTSLHFNNIVRLASQKFGSILKLLTNLKSRPFSGLFGQKKVLKKKIRKKINPAILILRNIMDCFQVVTVWIRKKKG